MARNRSSTSRSRPRDDKRVDKAVRPRRATLGDAALEAVQDLATQVAERLGYELVTLTYSGGSRRGVLRVTLDSDDGISHGDCAQFSTSLGEALENSDHIEGPYSLEVSSPGATRPFSELRHYLRNLNQIVDIQLKEPWNDQSQYRGLLIDANEESIRLRPEGVRKGPVEEIVIPMALVRKANRSIQI